MPPDSAIAPPPPPGFSTMDAPPPPPGFSTGDAPPPPPGFSTGAAPTTPPPPAVPPLSDVFTPRGQWDETKGKVKGVAHTISGLLNLYSRVGIDPTGFAASSQARQGAAHAADWINQHTVTHGPAQQRGEQEENLAEWLFGGEEKAGAGVAEEAAAKLPKVSEQLAALTERAKVFDKFPDLHALVKRGIEATENKFPVLTAAAEGAVKGAARGGVEQGAQTAVKTGGDEDATEDAIKTGMEWGGTLGGVTGGVTSRLQKTANTVDALRPGTRTVAGADYETDPKTGDLMLRNLKDIAKKGGQDPATQAAEESFGNIAREGLSKAVTDINGARSLGVESPSIRLASGDTMTINQARKTLASRDSIIRNTPMSKITLNRAVAARDDLAEQIGRYDKWAAAQPFHPGIDPVDVGRNTDSLEDAGQHLLDHQQSMMNHIGPEGAFDLQRLRSQEDELRDEIANPTAKSRPYADIDADIAQNQADQTALFRKYGSVAKPEEAKAALQAGEYGHFFQNLHDFVQKRFNSITPEEAAASKAGGGKLQRVYQPDANNRDFAKDFDNWLDQPSSGGATTNRDIAQRTIGDQRITDMKDMGEMFDSAQRREQTRGLMQNIFSSIKRHYQGIRGYMYATATPVELALAATHHWGMMADVAGIPIGTGTFKGTQNFLANRITTDPKFLKSFVYAIKKGLPARTAGPLLAAQFLARIGATQSNADARQQPQPQEQK